MKALRRGAAILALAAGLGIAQATPSQAYYYDYDFKPYSEITFGGLGAQGYQICMSVWYPMYYANGQIGGGYLAYLCG